MNVYNSGIPATGVAWETNVERIIPIGSLVCVILIVSSTSSNVSKIHARRMRHLSYQK